MFVGDLGVAHILMPWCQVAAGSEKKKCGSTGCVLNDLPHGPDEVRRDRGVVPGERGRVTGVVDKDGSQSALWIGDASHQQRVVRNPVWIEAADDAFLMGVRIR